jgi:hypothetical protein
LRIFRARWKVFGIVRDAGNCSDRSCDFFDRTLVLGTEIDGDKLAALLARDA